MPVEDDDILYHDTYNNPCAARGRGIIISGGFENG